jgi:hypothetical protein
MTGIGLSVSLTVSTLEKYHKAIDLYRTTSNDVRDIVRSDGGNSRWLPLPLDNLASRADGSYTVL